ncbi:hypothetical protein [Thiococcus pfennigii]|uniref:hypothetical protein n=1 Tax=Thiococcus pfennigii TaxID=1057 RepID=UPI0019079D8C|nr:hypothetical protein [Thiococcus pfennigii]MBK1699731.1 hypothetical protein [Thiococcus pfennigii]
MNWIWFDNAGSAGTYYAQGSSFIPAVRLGAALPGMQAIPRASETEERHTGLLVRQDADNWQLWDASFTYWDDNFDEWNRSGTALLSAGTLTDQAAVEVRAVLIADMLEALVAQIEADAHVAKVVAGTTYAVTADDHNKVLICTHASGCTISIDTSFAARLLCFHVIQRGGQNTLAAGSNWTFNGAGQGVDHAITDSAAKKTSVYQDGASWNTWTVTA